MKNRYLITLAVVLGMSLSTSESGAQNNNENEEAIAGAMAAHRYGDTLSRVDFGGGGPAHAGELSGLLTAIGAGLASCSRRSINFGLLGPSSQEVTQDQSNKNSTSVFLAQL